MNLWMKLDDAIANWKALRGKCPDCLHSLKEHKFLEVGFEGDYKYGQCDKCSCRGFEP